jgi:putative transposase
MDNRWTSSSHVTYNCSYHFIWCPKYRRKILLGDIETRFKVLLHEKANCHGWKIEKLEVMPDHVHRFIKTGPTDSPTFIASQRKGFTSRMLRSEFDSLRSRLPTLWTRSFYVETIGHVSEATIKKFIDEQKTK